MMYKTITSPICGRLGNQLYIALQANILGKKFRPQRCLDQLKKIIPNILSMDFECESLLQDRYYSIFNVDFKEDQLNSFIREHILFDESTVNYYRQKIQNKFDMDRTCAIHIRNGDYLQSKDLNYFNREKYMQCVFEQISKNIDTINIYSDDIGICVDKYDGLFKSRFNNVNYMSNDVCIDFCEMCSYKTKILFNSTFSFWTGYVSNVIYDFANYQCIWCPKRLYGNSKPEDIYQNMKWNLIDTEVL